MFIFEKSCGKPVSCCVHDSLPRLFAYLNFWAKVSNWLHVQTYFTVDFISNLQDACQQEFMKQAVRLLMWIIPGIGFYKKEKKSTTLYSKRIEEKKIDYTTKQSFASVLQPRSVCAVHSTQCTLHLWLPQDYKSHN